MVLSHFLRPESGLLIRKNGFSTTMRWLSVMNPDTESDTEITTHLKRRVASKELRDEKVESFVRKYMESNSGNFPKATTVQKEVGGSFYTVKAVLRTLKEKILGNKQPGIDQNPNLPTPGVNPLASNLEQNSQLDTGILQEVNVNNSNMEQNIGKDSDNAAKESSEVTAVNVSSSSSELQGSDGNGDQREQKVIIGKSDFPRNSHKNSELSRMFSRRTNDETYMERNNQRLQSDVVPSGGFVSPASKLSTFYISSPSDPPKKLQWLFGPSNLDISVSGSHSSENEKPIQSEFDPKMNMSLEDTRMSNDQTPEGNTLVKSSHLIKSFLDHIDERQEKEPKSSDVKHLIGCIKQISLRPSVSEPSQNKAKSSRTKFNFVRTDNEIDLKAQEHEYVSTPLAKLKMSAQPSNDVQNNDSSPFKAVVKFLRRHIKEKDLISYFESCGDISRVELPYAEGAFFHHANVYFKKKEGLRNALQRGDNCLVNVPITIEAADDVNITSNRRILIPDIIGDPNFPVALGKNPTRTVMIKPLTHDISSTRVESAFLSFCGTKVTAFFLGSSNSVAYVELQTEEAKERALSKQSIDILGKKVTISRIDVPRTTVVRIFHSTPRSNELNNFCFSVGKVIYIRKRTDNIVDVNYALDEWPNMLNILKRLNGAQVDGQALLAQPATVIVPEILRVLWAHQCPNGRKHVVSMMQSLLKNLEEGNIVEKSNITHLVKRFYGTER